MTDCKKEWRFPFFAMGSPCELRINAECEAQANKVFGLAESEVQRLELRYSRFRADSMVSRINAAAGSRAVEVDAETAGLLDYAQVAFEQSSGLFDITSGILREAWDFKSARLPANEDLQALLPFVGWDQVEWQSPFIRLPAEGMQLDFGGFVKEYAADSVARLCRAQGIEHGLIDLGGDIHIIGPHPDATGWQVGIRDPRCPEKAINQVELQSGGIATSGDYERFIQVDGKRYCHILNPKTGWPCGGLAAVAVAAPLCILAGSATTIAMLKGREEGPAWLEDLGLPHFWVTEDGQTGGDL